MSPTPPRAQSGDLEVAARPVQLSECGDAINRAALLAAGAEVAPLTALNSGLHLLLHANDLHGAQRRQGHTTYVHVNTSNTVMQPKLCRRAGNFARAMPAGLCPPPASWLGPSTVVCGRTTAPHCRSAAGAVVDGGEGVVQALRLVVLGRRAVDHHDALHGRGNQVAKSG